MTGRHPPQPGSQVTRHINTSHQTYNSFTNISFISQSHVSAQFTSKQFPKGLSNGTDSPFTSPSPSHTPRAPQKPVDPKPTLQYIYVGTSTHSKRVRPLLRSTRALPYGLKKPTKQPTQPTLYARFPTSLPESTIKRTRAHTVHKYPKILLTRILRYLFYTPPLLPPCSPDTVQAYTGAAPSFSRSLLSVHRDNQSNHVRTSVDTVQSVNHQHTNSLTQTHSHKPFKERRNPTTAHTHTLPPGWLTGGDREQYREIHTG